MYEIKVLSDEKTAIEVGEFLTHPDTFDQIWAPDEKEFVKQAPIDSVGAIHHRYWYVEEKGKIIATMGVRENKYGSGGYEMDADYMAVHKEYRNLGLASQLLKEVEEYIMEKKGRYLHVLTTDTEGYKPARAFYEKHGYRMVGEFPDYYVIGEGRIDYLKRF